MSNKYAINYIAANSNPSSRALYSIAMAVALVFITSGLSAPLKAQALSSRNSLARLAQQGGNDAANAMFRGGRDLITDQQWAKAEEKFRQYVTGFPNEKNVDAALYWLAYSEYQLTRFDQCRSTITRLLKNYQNSSWKNDARTLLAQIPESYGTGSGSGSGVGVGVVSASAAAQTAAADDASAPRLFVTPRVAQTPQAALAPMPDFPPMPDLPPMPDFQYMFDFGEPGTRAADDDPCEFRIVVLQALFQSDVQRGISAATEWLA